MTDAEVNEMLADRKRRRDIESWMPKIYKAMARTDANGEHDRFLDIMNYHTKDLDGKTYAAVCEACAHADTVRDTYKATGQWDSFIQPYREQAKVEDDESLNEVLVVGMGLPGMFTVAAALIAIPAPISLVFTLPIVTIIWGLYGFIALAAKWSNRQ
jgi:hypothetical protein